MAQPRGFSIVEAVLAAAVFALIVTALVATFLYGEEATALSGHRARASQLAQEGLEAVRNIKDANFSNLVDGTYGLAVSGGVWAFSGASDVTDSFFTRQIVISTVDTFTKEATSTVTWQQNPQRTGSVVLTERFTDYPRLKTRGGLLVYADISGADDVVRYRTLGPGVSGTWSAELTVPAIGVPGSRSTRRLELYPSPTRTETILVTKHVAAGGGDDHYLYAQVWDGSTWGDLVSLASWAGTTNADVRDFDGDYLDNGNFVLVYDDNTTTPKYRIWDGSSWSAQYSAPILTGFGNGSAGSPEWIVTRSRPDTDTAMIVIQDSLGTPDTYTYLCTWNGINCTFSLSTEHGTDGPGSQYETIDFSWSPNDFDLGALVYQDASDQTINATIFDAGASTWSAGVASPLIGGTARSFHITPRSTATEWLACARETNNVQCYTFDSTPTWSTPSNSLLTTSTTGGNHRSYSISYESDSGDPALAVYSGGAANTYVPKYRTFTPGSPGSFSAEGSMTALGATNSSALQPVVMVPDTTGDDIVVLMGAADADLWVAIWDGANDAFYGGGKVQTELATSGSSGTDFWFDFTWDLN